MSAEDLVLIWSGLHQAYWRPHSNGYTRNPAEALQLTRRMAEQQTRLCGAEQEIEFKDVPTFGPGDVAHLAERLEEAISSRSHTQQWYGERWRVLADWFRGPGKDLPIANEFWGIYANGAPTMNYRPSYAQQLNMARYRAERAESGAKGMPLDVDDFMQAVRALEEQADLLRRAADGEAFDLPATAIKQHAALIERLRRTYFDGVPTASD